MAKSVAIVQSNYVPWIGYFDLIRSVDEFVLYDEVQFTRRDWRNRNRIRTPEGSQWLTIPVLSKGQYFAPISTVSVRDADWVTTHWRTLELNYKGAEHYGLVSEELRSVFLALNSEFLSEINSSLLRFFSSKFGFATAITNSAEYQSSGSPSQRLLDICLSAGATKYISGPAAKTYLDEEIFSRSGVEVEFFSYPEYPAYPQKWDPFVPNLSILDVVFNRGWNVLEYLEEIEK